MIWNRHIFRLTLVFAIFVVAALCEAQVEVERISSDARGLTLKIVLDTYTLKNVDLDGGTYTSIDAAQLVTFAKPGEPAIPLYSTLVASPGKVRIVSYTRSDEEVVENVRIMPVPYIGSDDERGLPVYTYEEDADAYGSERYPSQAVWLGNPGRLRNQDVIRLFVAPFIYEPSQGKLRIAKQVTVHLEFESQGLLGRARLDDNVSWERLLKDVVINYEQARAWRVRPSPLMLRGEGANSRLKILVSESGLYDLDFDTASNAGFPEGIATDDIFLYRDEFHEGNPDSLEVKEIAIEAIDADENGIFSQGDHIIFYAKDFYDEFGYQGSEDIYFDKNVYWLSWGPGEHARVKLQAGWREATSPAKPTHFTDFVHIEKDSFFINTPPYGDFDLFAWARYQRSLNFYLPGVEPNEPATLETKFASYYYNYGGAPTISDIALFIKGCSGELTSIDTVRVNRIPSIRQFSSAIPSGLLCEGPNTFRFESSLPADKKPGNMLDWFEVFYERRYEAKDGVLEFTSGSTTGEIEIEVVGFTSPDIIAYDITDLSNVEKIDLTGRITPEGGTYKIVFRDSISSQHTYVASTAQAISTLSSSAIAFKNPPRLRGEVGDYIVITHPDFLDEVMPLVEHRELSHSVTLATAEEVYDDFGNGMKSDVAIKRFIKHGFYRSNSAFVLLVGDANLDRKGILLVPPDESQDPSDIDYLPSHNFMVTEPGNPNFFVRPYEYWFVSVDGPGDQYPDLYLGRLPVGSDEEASGAVGKILSFETYSGEDPWKRRLLLVSDDAYRQWEFKDGDMPFKEASESVAAIASGSVVAPDTVKFYLERCLKDDQPEKRENHEPVTPGLTINFTRSNCTPELISLLNDGALIVNYQGHANRQQFTHEWLVLDYDTPFGTTYRDIRNLTNRDKPFIFFGYGCWMADFQMRAEPAPAIGDAIAEKFITNPNGAGCASVASSCAESITDNRNLNIIMANVLYSHLPELDPSGNPIPARLLLGEIVLSGLLRFGRIKIIEAYVTLGDPAMVIDMGPPKMTVSLGDSLLDESYVFEGEAFDTLSFRLDVRDDEAIVSNKIVIIENGIESLVPEDAYEIRALIDTSYAASRAYEITYNHVPHLGTYVVRFSSEDYSGASSSFGVSIATGSVGFFADTAELSEGGSLVFGQKMIIDVERPFIFHEDDITVYVDTIPASDFQSYDVTMKDSEGKHWQIAFLPRLGSGQHEVTLNVQGFEARRSFNYVPVRITLFIEDVPMVDNDYVSVGSTIEIVVEAESGIAPEDIYVAIDSLAQTVTFQTDSTVVRGYLDVPELDPGNHEIEVNLFSFSISRKFQISSEEKLIDVSIYPNPFTAETYFSYILSKDADEVILDVFSVAGRRIFSDYLETTTGYHQYRWSGEDLDGDRIANGTYLYRITAKWGSSKRTARGWVVKIE